MLDPAIARVLAGTARLALVHGDSRVVLPTLPDACVDGVVQDPPGGGAYLGLGWDTHHGGRDAWVRHHVPIFGHAKRVTKPGGYSLTWGFPRTLHWTMTALEDAGWELLDLRVHMHAQGMSKSAASFAPGAEFWVFARAGGPARALRATPRPRTVSLEHADACAEACAPDCPVAILDAQAGVRKSGAMRAGTLRARSDSYSGNWGGAATTAPIAASAGPASRFYYCAKARGKARSGHPTQKSLELTAWMMDLIVAPGEVALDAFAGSGTTLCAARTLGVRAIGIEDHEPYVRMAEARLTEDR
jgi:hypothetical protein